MQVSRTEEDHHLCSRNLLNYTDPSISRHCPLIPPPKRKLKTPQQRRHPVLSLFLPSSTRHLSAAFALPPVPSMGSHNKIQRFATSFGNFL